jgi:hypothetical protein
MEQGVKKGKLLLQYFKAKLLLQFKECVRAALHVSCKKKQEGRSKEKRVRKRVSQHSTISLSKILFLVNSKVDHYRCGFYER